MASSLDDLMQEDPEICIYFLSLPPDVQDALTGHSEEICNVEELRQYVDLLME